MDERRAFPRNDVRIDGRVMAPDMSCFMDCVITNISEDGALVRTDQPARFGQKAYLWQVQTGTLFECDVRWRKGDRLFGLHFVDVAGRSRRRDLMEANALRAQPAVCVFATRTRSAARAACAR